MIHYDQTYCQVCEDYSALNLCKNVTIQGVLEVQLLLFCILRSIYSTNSSTVLISTVCTYLLGLQYLFCKHTYVTGP